MDEPDKQTLPAVPPTSAAPPVEAGTRPGAQPEPEEAERPVDLVEVLHTLADRWKELLELVKGLMGEQRLRREGEGRFRFRMALLGGVFLLVVVGIVAWLTYVGKLDNSNFAFLLGLIVGAMLTLTRDLISPPKSGG